MDGAELRLEPGGAPRRLAFGAAVRRDLTLLELDEDLLKELTTSG